MPWLPRCYPEAGSLREKSTTLPSGKLYQPTHDMGAPVAVPAASPASTKPSPHGIAAMNPEPRD